MVALLVLGVAAGCGSVAAPPTSVATSASQPPGPSGWLSAAPDGVVFLTWTHTDSTLAGSITWVHTTPAAPHDPVVETAAVTGTINGQSVNLSLAPALTTSEMWTGQLQGEHLTVSYTASDGSITALALVPGDAAGYNSALDAFRAAEQTALLAEQASAASAAAESAARECSIRVVYHNAMIVVHGANAREECAWLAAHVPKDPANTYGWDPGMKWGPVQQPIEVVSDITKFGSAICSGTVSSFAVEVWDTGGAQFGSIACQSLGLTP